MQKVLEHVEAHASSEPGTLAEEEDWESNIDKELFYEISKENQKCPVPLKRWENYSKASYPEMCWKMTVAKTCFNVKMMRAQQHQERVTSAAEGKNNPSSCQ